MLVEGKIGSCQVLNRDKKKKKIEIVFETVEWLRERLEVEPPVPVRARQEGDGRDGRKEPWAAELSLPTQMMSLFKLGL